MTFSDQLRQFINDSDDDLDEIITLTGIDVEAFMSGSTEFEIDEIDRLVSYLGLELGAISE